MRHSMLLPLSLVLGCATSHGPGAPPATPANDPTILVPTIVQCPSSSVFKITAKNRTPAQVDLCGAFDRAFSQVPQASDLGPAGSVDLEIDLTEVEVSTGVKCHLRLVPTVDGKALTFAIGGAEAAPRPGEPPESASVAQDCVDVVVDSLLVNKVIPTVRQHVARSAPAQNVR